MLQADIDDESPQVLAAAVDVALQAGALDAHITSIVMKKGRPGHRVEILCRPAERDKFVLLLLTQTSTLGVKARSVDRYSLERHEVLIDVDGAPIRVKVAVLDGAPLRAVPEYDDCVRLAEAKGLPLKTVLERAKTIAAVKLLAFPTK